MRKIITIAIIHFKKAHKDKRFIEAVNILKEKVTNGKIVVENPNGQLADMDFCRKGQQSEIATIRYDELIKNIG